MYQSGNSEQLGRQGAGPADLQEHSLPHAGAQGRGQLPRVALQALPGALQAAPSHVRLPSFRTDWMGHLTATEDAKTSQLLAADYQALKLEMPKPKIEEEKTPKP